MPEALGAVAEDPPPPTSDLPWRLVLAGVLTLTAVVFLTTLGFGFVYDDHWVLLDNGFLRDPSNLPRLLGPEAVRDHVPDAFRPASVAFETLVYAVFGVSEVGQHAVSLALYVGLTALLARWMRERGAPVVTTATAAAIFGTMAIHAEAVSVVSYREDLLAAVFGLAALVFADLAIDRRRPPRIRVLGATLAVACMFCASASKLSAAPLVVVWPLMRWLDPWRAEGSPSSRRDLATGILLLAAGLAAALALRGWTLGELSPYGADTGRVLAHRIGWTPVWAASLQIHLEYLRQMILPGGFSPDYVDYGAAFTDPATLLAAGAWLGLLGIGLAAARRRRVPLVALSILGAMVLALPTSNLAPLPTMRADRFMLLPSVPVAIGLAAAASWIGERLVRWLGARAADHPGAIRLAPVAVFVAVQGATAQGAAAAYRSDTRLWSVAMHRSPHSARAHGIYGELLVARLAGRPNPLRDLNGRILAGTHCELARRFDPEDPIGSLCLGRLAALERRWLDATAHIEAALPLLDQRRERADLALASLALDREDLDYPARIQRSALHLERALREAPYAAEVHAVAARLHHRLGHAEAARRDYATARSLRPERWDLVLAALELELDLGHASAARQIWSESRTLLRKADPARKQATQRRLDEARRLFGPHDDSHGASHDP